MHIVVSTPVLNLSYVPLLFFPQTSDQVPEQSTAPLNPRKAGKLWVGVGFVLIYVAELMFTKLYEYPVKYLETVVVDVQHIQHTHN